MKSESMPMKQGRGAARDGVSILSCPYPMGSAKALSWEEGWRREKAELRLTQAQS